MKNTNELVAGFGLMSCEEFIAAKKDHRWLYEANLQWILGYTTALSQTAQVLGEVGGFGNLDWEYVARWLEDYSLDNPKDSLADAAARLYATFSLQGEQRVIH